MSSPIIKRTKYIDEEHRIPETTPESVYEILLEWCNTNNVKITKQTKPRIIEATQGKFFYNLMDFSQSKKKITFIITQEEEDTILRTIVEPPWWFGSAWVNEVKRGYYDTLKSLWTILEVAPPSDTEELYSIEAVLKERVNGMRNVYIGIIVFCVGFLWDIFGNRLFFNISWIDFIFDIGIIIALLGLFAETQARKRIRQIDPDYVFRGMPENRNIKILTVIVIVGFTGIIVWSITAPKYVTYDKYGFSFQYNRWWAIEESGRLVDDANLTQGLIQIKNTSEYDDTSITLLWVRVSGGYFNLENIIDSRTSHSSYIFNLSDFQYKWINGTQIVFKEGTIIHLESGNEFCFSICSFYSNPSDRLFIGICVSDDDWGLTQFHQLLDSFKDSLL